MQQKNKLNTSALGLSAGAVYALIMLLLWLAALRNKKIIEDLLPYHPFFSSNALGLIAGILEGLIYGFIFGYLIAYLYNRFAA